MPSLGTPIDRRSLLIGAGACVASNVFSVPAYAQGLFTADVFQDWISANTVPVRSIDSRDEDFSDLQSLAAMVGSARIVQIGEPGHGAGSAFAAKVRMIKYLHQHLGFDVLVWESGFHAMRAVDAGLAGNDALPAVARRGLFNIYGQAEQVQPLLQYARASHRSSRPLNFAGFDMQFTSPNEVNQLEADLRALIARVSNGEARQALLEQADQAFAAYREMIDVPTEEQADVLTTASNRLHASLVSYRDAATQPDEAVDLDSLLVAIENLREFGVIYRYVAPNSPQGAFNNRDRYFATREERNAQNLWWLAHTRYPGRKLIVWAHTIHVAHAWFAPGFREMRARERADYFKGMGRHVADEYGDDVYTIAITTYEGDDGLATANQATAIAPASPESLEATLHNLGHAYALVDLRSIRDEEFVPPIMMRLPLPSPPAPGTPSGYGLASNDALPHLFDGIFYIDRMMPAAGL